MKNQAKCKLCKDVIESIAYADIVTCSCGEVTVWGGTQELLISFTDPKNVCRLNELGNEVAIRYEDSSTNESENGKNEDRIEPIRTKDMIEELDRMIQSDYKLPEHAKSQPLLLYDLIRYGMLINAIFKSLCKG